LRLRTLVLIASAVVTTGCGSSTGPGSAATDASGGATAAGSSATRTSSGAPSSPAEFTISMPDLVGKRLIEAEGMLTGTGFNTIKPVDATGQHRVVINPENWLVRSQDPPAGARVTTHTAITLEVAKPTDQAVGAITTAGVVPAVVCKDLQTAQDALQAAGFYNLGSQDGTGQGRAQLIDRNWIVIAQSAPAGSRPHPDTRIVLTAVKYGEPTGSSHCRS
jgi:beta-lactam-binding protein with PASTA domain